MMSLEVFLLGLLIVSTLTGLLRRLLKSGWTSGEQSIIPMPLQDM